MSSVVLGLVIGVIVSLLIDKKSFDIRDRISNYTVIIALAVCTAFFIAIYLPNQGYDVKVMRQRLQPFKKGVYIASREFRGRERTFFLVGARGKAVLTELNSPIMDGSVPEVVTTVKEPRYKTRWVWYLAFRITETKVYVPKNKRELIAYKE